MIINLTPYKRKSSLELKYDAWMLHHLQNPFDNNNIQGMTTEEHQREHQINSWSMTRERLQTREIENDN